MSCKKIEQILPGYIDNALSRQERVQVEEHLAVCPACRGTLIELKRMLEIVQEVDEEDSPPWLAAQIMARVRADSDRRHGILEKLFFPLHVKVPLEALAMICVALLIVAVYRAGGPEVPRMALNPMPHAQQSQGVSGSEAPERALQSAPPTTPPHVRKPDNTAVLYQQRGQASLTDSAGRQGTQFSTTARKGVQEESITMPAQTAPSLPEQQTPREKMAAEALPPGIMEKKDKLEKKVVSDTAASAMRSLAPQAPASLRAQSSPAPADTLKMTVPDMDATAEKVAELMRAFHAQGIERQAQADTIVLTSRLQNEDLPAFLVKLRSLGNLEGGASLPQANGGATAVRVEIVSGE